MTRARCALLVGRAGTTPGGARLRVGDARSVGAGTSDRTRRQYELIVIAKPVLSGASPEEDTGEKRTDVKLLGAFPACQHHIRQPSTLIKLSDKRIGVRVAVPIWTEPVGRNPAEVHG